ncbi:MAG: NUDIX hydrolase [Chloroflexi bacterium]|nr:NUDIX hydrolase [Chloroflexota bacterium]
MKFYQIVAALIADTTGICLVQQQGPGDAAPSWALPGGVMEEGEMIPEALAREVREETGLKVESLGRLISIVQHHSPSENAIYTTHILQVVKWSGQLRPEDPDSLILRAEFASLRDTLARLQTAPSRTMWEPITGYLRGEAPPGTVWCYRSEGEGNDRLVARIDGRGLILPL